MTKKILLLGGSAQQVIAIKTAKDLGYLTVLCDYSTDNPGQFFADKFFLISTTDKDAVLKVAVDEKNSRIIAYASDPTAPNAAYVADKLHLPGNPIKCIETDCNKDYFRKFLKDNDFNVGYFKRCKNINDSFKDISELTNHLPLIIKPVDSSGSKGVTLVHNHGRLKDALSFTFSKSLCRVIVCEEFITNSLPFLIVGDIFVIDRTIKIFGLLNCHRDNDVNPLVPAGKSFPASLNMNQETLVKNELQKLVINIGFRNGSMNVELVIDKNQNVRFFDIVPRNGGNMISEFLSYIFDIDFVKLGINCAMGNKITLPTLNPKKYYATYNLHSYSSGIFKDIIFSKDIEQLIYRKEIYCKKCDVINSFKDASNALSIIFMKFSDEKTMHFYLSNVKNI